MLRSRRSVAERAAAPPSAAADPPAAARHRRRRHRARAGADQAHRPARRSAPAHDQDPQALQSRPTAPPARSSADGGRHRDRRRHDRRAQPRRRSPTAGRRRRALPRVHPALPPARLGRARRRRDLEAVGDARRASSTQLDGEPIAAIGITNQRETVVAWDRRDRASRYHRAIVWQDRRTADRCAELEAAGHLPLVRDRTGLVLDPYFSAHQARVAADRGRRRGRRRPGARHDRLLARCGT